MKEIENKRLAAQAEAEKKQREQRLKEEEIKHAADELAKVKSLLERGTAKQNQLKAELKSVQVSSEERKTAGRPISLLFTFSSLTAMPL